MNTLTTEYRRRVPNDPRSDDEITLLLGQSNQDGRFNSYPDFVEDYTKLSAPEPVERPPIAREFGRGVSSGMSGLKSSAYGAGALAADVVGADETKQALVEKYHQAEADAAQNGPTVGKIEDIHSVGDAARYALGKAGEFVPMVGEAALAGLAGAVAGTAVEPGGGTVAGGVSGFFGRQVAKSLIKTLVEKGEKVIADKATREIVKGQLEKIAAKEVVGTLDDATRHLLEAEIKSKAKKLGMTAAEALNFAGISAGAEFPKLDAVNPEDAKLGALISAIGGASGAVLPAGVLGKLFPGVGTDVAATYVKRLARNAGQHLPAAVLGMTLPELSNIAAERYTDPKRRDQPLTDEELSRLLNAAAVGGILGTVTTPVAAGLEHHFANVSKGRREQIAQLKGRLQEADAAGLPPHAEDVAMERTLNAEERNFITVTEPAKTVATSISSEDQATSKVEGAITKPAIASEPEPGTTPVAGGETPTPPVPAPGFHEKELGDLDKRNEELQRKRAAAAISIAPQGDPAMQAAKARMEAARARTNPTPSTAEKLAGNYAKGKVNIDGLEISIENPKGTERTGIGPDGKPWSNESVGDYGYFLGSRGKDKEHVDVTVGPNPKAETVYVVDQIDPKTGKFNEHKVQLGFESQTQAEAAYDAAFSDGSGPQRRGAVTAMSKDKFKEWLKGDTTKALKYEQPKETVKTEVSNADKVEVPVEEIRSGPEAKAAAPQVAEGKPGEVQQSAGAGTGETKASATDEGKGVISAGGVSPHSGMVISGDAGGLRGNERDKLTSKGQDQPLPARFLKPEDVDVEHRGTYQESARGRKGKTGVVENAWFRPEGDESMLKLSDRLISDSSPPSGAHNNSESYRESFVHDQLTDKVYGLSTFVNNNETRVTKFGDRAELLGDGKKDKSDVKSWALTDVLRAKMPDGNPRYKVVGSARLKDLSEYLHHEWPDKATFEKEFAGPVEQRQDAVRAGASAYEKTNVQQRGEISTEAALGEEAVSDEPSTGPEFQHEPEPLNLKPEEVGVIVSKLPEKLTVDEMADLVKSDPSLMEVFRKIATADPEFFPRVEEVGLKRALKEYGYETDTGTAGKVERQPVGDEGRNLSDARRGVESGQSGAPPTVEGQQDSAGPPKPAEPAQGPAPGQGGDTIAGDAGAGLKYNLPNEQASSGRDARGVQKATGIQASEANAATGQDAEGSNRHDVLLTAIHEAAAKAGIDVQTVQGTLGSGAYDPKNRTLLQVLGDTIGAQDVKTALHEVGHDIFAREPADVRDRLLRAVDALSDDALGVDLSADTRIRSSDPANLGPKLLGEERLVEATALKLAQEGFDPAQAKGFAQTFVRAVKDYYLRAAMAVQRMLGFQENPDLALRYFENRVKRLLAGDTSRQSYLNWLGLGKPSTGERWQQWFDNGQSTGERLLSTGGHLEYDYVPDGRLAATRFNVDALRFNLPEPVEPRSRTVEIEKKAAVLNHLHDLATDMGKTLLDDKALAEAIGTRKPDAWLLELLGITHPDLTKKELEQARETTGAKVPFDHEKRIDGFQHDANRDEALSQAYQLTQHVLTKVDGMRRRAQESIAVAGKHIEKREAKYQEKKSFLQELLDLKKDSAKDIKNIDQMIGRAKAESERAGKALSAAKRQLAIAEQKIAVADRISPTVSKEMGKLGGRLGLGSDFVFAHDAIFNVPEKPEATSAEVMKSTAQLKLDSTGKLMSRLETEAKLSKMAAFLDHRESRASSGDEYAKDFAYQGVKRQFHEIAANKIDRELVQPAQRSRLELRIMPDGQKIADSIGSPMARIFGRMWNKRTDVVNEMNPQAEKIGHRTGQLEDAVLKVLNTSEARKRGVVLTREALRQNFLNPAKRLMMNQEDLLERFAHDPARLRSAIYARLRESLLKRDATRELAGPVIEQLMPALRNLLTHHADANTNFLLERVRRAETGVLDPKLKVLNPATGEMEPGGVRRHLKVGEYTFSQKLARNFTTMVKALRDSDWASLGDTIGKVAETYNKEGAEAAEAMVARFFSHPENFDQVNLDFFKPIAELDDHSLFSAPDIAAEGEKIVKSPADPMLVKQAYQESEGKPVAFAQRLFELHDGQGDAGQFIQDTLSRLNEIFHEVDSIYAKHEPAGAEKMISLRGMTPDALIDARTIEHLPGEWFDYHSFDRSDMHRMTERIASQTAFGRGQQNLGAVYDTIANEIFQAEDKLSKATRAIQRSNEAITAKELQKRLQDKFGPEEFKKLNKQVERKPLVERAFRDISAYFRKQASPDAELNAWVRMSQALGNMMVNGPSSAIYQLAALADFALRYGGSKTVVGSVVKSVGEIGKELAASLAQTVGIHLAVDGEFTRRFNDLGLGDPAVIQKSRDAFDRQEGEGSTTAFFRGLNDLMGTGLNRLGEKAQHTVFRPLQPFITSAVMANRVMTKRIWNLAGLQVMRGMEFYKSNPERLADAGFKLTPEALKLRGLEKDSFVRLNGDMERYGLNYDDMVRGALKRSDKTLLTDAEAMRLYTIMMAEVSNEASLSTMPTEAYNSSLIRFVSPLLGWSFRRMRQVGSLRLNQEGQFDMRALGTGLAGLSVAAIGGLAVSGLVGQYYQDLLGKQRNLRPILGAPNPQEFALGVMENLNRVGTLGMFGELVNGIVNAGPGGGDNRMISVDQRVVAFSAFQSMQQAISAWFNQGEADYAHVIRPMSAALGGGGALQYMQMANHVFGLDNPEARINARINAQNYLRVVGRQLGLEVRKPSGGPSGSSATSLTPSMTRMELAAYANNAGDFREAYHEAIQRAKDEGHEDAVAFVKRSFAQRNPLKTVFRTPPTEQEYHRLLAYLPTDGQQDVSEAVNLFNNFAEQIGASEFEGRKEKPETKLTFKLPTFGSNPKLFKTRSVEAIYR